MLNLRRTARMHTLLFLGLLASTGKAYELQELVFLDAEFSMPESAVMGLEGQWIYVSNVNHYAKDNNGFISRVSLDGSTLNLRWATGLHSPTGLSIFKDSLFVADYDALVEVALSDGQILNRYPAPDATPTLNDTVVAPDGTVYVTGSSSSSIYMLDEGELRLWHHDEMLLENANGLFATENHLIQGGRRWIVFDRHTREVVSDAITPVPTLREIDGISEDGCNGYLVTLIDDSRLWRVYADGHAVPLSDTSLDGIDLSWRNGLLVMPRVPDSLSVYRVDSANCD